MEDGPPCDFVAPEEEPLCPTRACGPEWLEEQSLSWLKCLLSQSVCDQEAFRRRCHMPTQRLVCGLPMVSDASPRPRIPLLQGDGRSVCGAQRPAQPDSHQDVTGTVLPRGVWPREAHGDSEGPPRLVVHWLLGFLG